MKTLTNRSRETSTPIEWKDATIHYVGGSTDAVFNYGPYPVYLHSKRIDDFHGKLRDPKGLFPNSDTLQWSYDASRLNPLANWIQNEVGGEFITNLTTHVVLDPAVVFNFPFVSDNALDIFAEKAFNSFSTQIPAEISIGNFVWELREIASLIPKLERGLQDTISGSYLNFQFGWKPFLKDLVVLSGLLNTVNAKIQHLRDTYGKKTRLGLYQANAVEIPIMSSYTQHQYDPRFALLHYDWELKSYRCDFRAGGYLSHHLEGLNTVYGFNRALIVSLGLDNPLKTLWNAIPYSFVADWFTGLSRHLDTLSVNPFKGDWRVDDLSFSASCTAEWSVSQVVSDPFQVYNLGSVKAKRYLRISRLPVPSAFEGFQAPSPQQLLLLSAMLAQQ